MIVSHTYLFSEDSIMISYIIYGIFNILGEKVNLVKMDRVCTESYETAEFLGRSSTKPSGAQSGKEVSYDYTDTLGFVRSSTSRFNGPHGAAPPQGSVGPLLQCHIWA